MCVFFRAVFLGARFAHAAGIRSPARRPDVATSQRDRRREHGRSRRAGQPSRVAMLRDRLAAADRHVVASRPYVANDVRPVRTAQRPFADCPAGHGQRARPVHLSGV